MVDAAMGGAQAVPSTTAGKLGAAGAAGGPAAAGLLLRLWQGRGLAAQVAAAAAAAATAGALLALIPAVGAALAAWPTWALLLVGGGLAALASTAPAAAAGRAMRAIGEAARALRRADLPDDQELPQAPQCSELGLAAARLRRLVQTMREHRAALRERNAQLGTQLSVRTHELTTLQDLSLNLAAKQQLHELVDEALKALEQTVDYGSASLWAREALQPQAPVLLMGFRAADAEEGGTAHPLVGQRLSRANLQRYEQFEREREPVIDNDARQSLLSWLWELIVDDARTSNLYRATRAWMGVPLKFHDSVLGVLRVDHGEPGYFTPERARLLGAVCSQAALAMRHAQMLATAREVAVLAERNRIARDLHDAVSQTLFAAQMIAGTLNRVAQRDAAPWGRQAGLLERLVRGALAEMRLLMVELKPDALEATPLHELLQLAVEALQCRDELQVQASLARDDGLSPAARQQLYRIAQEALSNLARHSKARQASVIWQWDGRHARLRIADDGIGFDPDAPKPGHFGLGHLKTRAAEIGARLVIRSAPGEGTDLTLEWDAHEPQAD